GGELDVDIELGDFNPVDHTILSLCKQNGTGFDVIIDNDREAFLPIIMAIEETIWSYYMDNGSLKDSDIIETLKDIRDNIFSEKVEFNALGNEILNKLKLVLYLNNYDRRDLSLSISSVLKSVKLHRSMSGSRGYLNFISGFFEEMGK
ncbi:MAG: hypothetical protein AABX82_05475, partial [Nanoarchaeota archaeon]